MNVKEYLKENVIYLDGGMGTLLQSHGPRIPERDIINGIFSLRLC